MRQICIYWGGQRRVFTSEELVEICNAQQTIPRGTKTLSEWENLLSSFSDTYKEFLWQPTPMREYYNEDYDDAYMLRPTTHPTILIHIDEEKIPQYTKDELINLFIGYVDDVKDRTFEGRNYHSFDPSSLTLFNLFIPFNYVSNYFTHSDVLNCIFPTVLWNLLTFDENGVCTNIPFSVEYIYDTPYSNVAIPAVSYNKETSIVQYIPKVKNISNLHIGDINDIYKYIPNIDSKKLYLYIIQNFNLSQVNVTQEPLYIGQTWYWDWEEGELVFGDVYVVEKLPDYTLLVYFVNIEKNESVGCTLHYDGLCEYQQKIA